MTFLKLQRLRPDNELEAYHLRPGLDYKIGRGSKCEIRLLEPKMSREHAVIEYKKDSWYFLDNDSANGSLINNVLCEEEKLLKKNDIISIGELTLTIDDITDNIKTESILTKTEENDFSDLEVTTEDSDLNDTVEIEKTQIIRKEDISLDEPPLEEEVKTEDKTTKRKNKTEEVVKTTKILDEKSDATENPDKKIFISLLGEKRGPFSRNEARELKKMELKGTLTEEDITERL